MQGYNLLQDNKNRLLMLKAWEFEIKYYTVANLQNKVDIKNRRI
ncbi:hypothetical protein NHP164001_14540 [Helicobacter trogontum]|uniref:Uncharacterized protein n=1 Tax=Helicobacter trogontum TaxID=50960 RepID=A0ABQ0D508_9HELI